MSRTPAPTKATRPAGPMRENDVRLDWITCKQDKILSRLDEPVVCGNSACGKTYTPRQGLDIAGLRLCCPHCKGGDKNPGGLSLAWTGQGCTCGRCKRRLPTRVVFFAKNKGLLFFRWTDDVGGVRCRTCIDRDFWEASTVSALFGWFGITSLILNPFLLGANFVRYLRTMGMPETFPAAEIDGPTREQIARELPSVQQDIEKNVGYTIACEKAARRLGVSPIDVRLALQESMRRRVADRL